MALPTYNVYVRTYSRTNRRSGYVKGDVRFEARVAGTKNDAALAKNEHYRKVLTCPQSSMQAALLAARREHAIQQPPQPAGAS